MYTNAERRSPGAKEGGNRHGEDAEQMHQVVKSREDNARRRFKDCGSNPSECEEDVRGVHMAPAWGLSTPRTLKAFNGKYGN